MPWQANFLPPHLLSFDFERRRASPTSLAPFVRHLATLMLLILAIGAVTHWATLHGKVKAIMGSVVLVVVGGVWLLPMLYGPRYLHKEDLVVEQADRLGYDGNLDSAYDSLLPEQDDEKGDEASLVTIDHNCISDSIDSSPKVLLHAKGAEAGVGKPCLSQPFVSFFGRHVPLREVMCHWRSYAIMCMFMCISGSGLLVTNNVQVRPVMLCRGRGGGGRGWRDHESCV